jgi:hypothetical protein
MPKGGQASGCLLVTIAVFPMVEGKHPTIHPSARVAAPKVARGVKMEGKDEGGRMKDE